MSDGRLPIPNRFENLLEAVLAPCISKIPKLTRSRYGICVRAKESSSSHLLNHFWDILFRKCPWTPAPITPVGSMGYNTLSVYGFGTVPTSMF
jgi:hypothetical protein